ncbi:MAG: class I SAM-dependent methyltransferase [Candidatus Liptonbacteria bacterium]|nr:class I SAM-dependent methyltransferase [Candidatus Liptonbacteria bacterium]
MGSAVVLAAYIFSLLVSLIFLYMLLRPIVGGAIYFPTSQRNVGVIVSLARVKSGERAADLGSGDGRVVIALAQAGAQEVHGFEINPLLVLRSRAAVKHAGLSGNVFIHWKSFWRADLSSFQVVAVYGIPHIMKSLEKKLARELKPGARVASNVFRFPRWAPAASRDTVYLYVRQ